MTSQGESADTASKAAVVAGLDDVQSPRPRDLTGEQSVGQHNDTPAARTSDGGLRAWVRVLGCFIIMVNTMGLQSSFGGFQVYYEQTLLAQYSPSAISWIGTIQVLCSSSGGALTGPLFDLGYDRYAISIGCFFTVLGYMTLSLSTQYYQIFLSQGVCGGLGGMLTFAPSVALTATSFRRKRALAVGLATGGFTFGAVIYPIVFRALLPKIGFPWTSRVIAFIALGSCLVAYPMVYWKTPRQKAHLRRLWDLQAWKEPPYAIFCWAMFFAFAGYWPPYFYISTFADHAIGTSIDFAFYTFAIINASNTVSRCTATIIADRFGKIETVTLCTAIAAIIAFCWSLVRTSAGTIIWSIFFGYFSGVMAASFGAIVPSLSPTLSVVGTRQGMLQGLFGIAALISPPVAGAILAKQGQENNASGWIGMQMWTAACWVVATVLFLFPLINLRRRSRIAKE